MHREKRYLEIAGVLFILFSILILFSLLSYSGADILHPHRSVNNLIGPFGAWVSHALRSAFGLSSYVVVLLLVNTGWLMIKDDWLDAIFERNASYILLMISSSALFSLVRTSDHFTGGGYVGHIITGSLFSAVGSIGTYCVVIVFNLIGLIFSGIFSFSSLHDIDIKEILTAAFARTRSFFSLRKSTVVCPQNTIDRKGKGRRFPWITKKRIIVYETEKAEERQVSSLQYLEMKDSVHVEDIPAEPENEESLAEGGFYPLQKYDTCNEEIITLKTDEQVMEKVSDLRECQIDAHPVGMETYVEPTVVTKELLDEGFNDECEDTDVAADSRVPIMNRAPIFEEIPINREYIIPTTFLCSSVPMDNESWQNEVRKNSTLLVNTLAEFGVESKVINVNRGPVITLYEMQIAPGIKVNKIVGLADDIAMALAASRVRVVAPIPGKSAIGVEVPNRERETVTLGDIITSDEYHNHHGSLKVGLGKDILGKPVMLDLKKLPHLLIAGATGSGKSVCVNSIITSLIYNYEPNYVRFILIDPKMVELQLYDGLPHLLTPVITDPMNVPQILKWTMYEMERRYRLLSELNTRDIERYNQKIELEKQGIEKLPFIVTFIDELADLMMVSTKEIEGYITRIAQKARAVGIHLVFATQRPSVDIITGVIKANIPARIAFQVAQKTDSRTIIDQNGAEKLLGKGDMLYQSPMSSFPIRIQGALIIEEEIMQIVSHLKKLSRPQYIDIEEYVFEDEMSDEIDGEGDALFVEALKIVEETKKASASYLQRRLSIGYNRAARIIEQMEDLGYIGPQQGSKPREVFI